MKLKDLIEAFAAEIERAQDQMKLDLDELFVLDNADPAFLDALGKYSDQTQRMGEAAELAGFPGLKAVCEHVVENSLLLAAQPPGERADLIEFLRNWPTLIVHYLHHLDDPSCAAGLVDYLEHAPISMNAEQGKKVMHMLGAIPVQVDLAEARDKPHRPVLASPEDVALVVADDVDSNFLEGFFQEAPEQVHHLVTLARNMVSGEADSSDIIAAKRVAHTLKGSGATIGLRGIAALGHHLEDILEYFEEHGGKVTLLAANALLDASYCLEQMVGYVMGNDDYPEQAQAVLQTVLDLANRIDAGESLDQPATRVAETMPRTAEAAASPASASPIKPRRVDPAIMQVSNTLRVNKQNIEELFLVSSEMSVGNAAMETRLRKLTDSSRELLAQNLRVQKRMFEMETILQMRMRTRKHSSASGPVQAGFDQLEMDQYNELHSMSNALAEEVADARALSVRMEEEIARVASQQTRQQRLSRDLQHLALGTRMTEVGVLESRLQRNVRSTCQATGKEAEMVLEGGNTLIDSELLNKLAEPLLHLLRNSVDHGIESPDQRVALGKPRAGRILLNFSRFGQQVILRCQDDGRGLDVERIRQIAGTKGLIPAGTILDDAEAARLILLPGFSTRNEVSEVSGRGIGLDVVHNWVTSMNGSIHIDSRLGQGCIFELRFAATLSTMPALIVEASGERFALPTVQVEQAVARGAGEFTVIGDDTIYRLGKKTYHADGLAELSGFPPSSTPLGEMAAIIVKINNRSQVLIVDRLLDARELLVSNPGRYARHLRGVAGLSILGDGTVAVNLDLAQLISGEMHGVTRRVDGNEEIMQDSTPRVLIVDDSLSVRNSLSQLLRDSGFHTETARDGIDAIQTMDNFKPDVVLTDLEMPNMNGVELTYHIRERPDMKDLPIFMITSRSQEKHRHMAEQAGVSGYFTKPYSDGDLVQSIRSATAH